MSADYFDRGPKANVHYCDPETMDHPLHRLMGMRRAGWWVLKKIGCLVDADGPFATREAAEDHREGWLRLR